MTVFDVASSMLRHASKDSLNTLKLQKLVFYSFGWYGHLTGEKLFSEQFFAMPKGPVVSPLLSAHYSMETVSADYLESYAQRPLELTDPYAEAVVDAVWMSYGKFSKWDLVEMTHLEKPWLAAWTSRPAGAKRSELDADSIVEHFQSKASAVYDLPRSVNVPILSFLPDRRVTSMTLESLREMENSESEIPAGHAASARELRRRFLTVT
ncbi:putative phage-associated protein [Arthrobacter sp. 2762]